MRLYNLYNVQLFNLIGAVSKKFEGNQGFKTLLYFLEGYFL